MAWLERTDRAIALAAGWGRRGVRGWCVRGRPRPARTAQSRWTAPRAPRPDLDRAPPTTRP